MIVDVHSHIMWYPDHISEETAREALASKLVKLQHSGGEVHAARLDLHSYDSRPQDHWEAAQQADKVVVFGMSARPTGISVPKELIAEYVASHPEKLIGWASVNPADDDAIDQLDHCVTDLGLSGLKVGPTYQHFDPTDRSHWPFFRRCSELGIPIMWHQGTTFPANARLRWALPLLLEDVAMAFPDLRMIIAHLGHPWEEDVIALIRKTPNMYADISAVHYRPWRYWQAMVTAMEYGVTHKLLLASDYPSGTLSNVINGLRGINDIVEGTKLPTIPTEIQDGIIYENWKQPFPEFQS
ncbi:MAG: amidohydrolase [Acidimicrobiia bacterium]|nr:amidohydrolase [Acidimicrobiia bacterium]